MANKNGHWYTDKNGNHYFVEEGQTPQEGWEASKRRKMINGGKYQVSEDGNEYRDVEKDEYDKFEADDASFDDNIDDDFGFDDEDGKNEEISDAIFDNFTLDEVVNTEEYAEIRNFVMEKFDMNGEEANSVVDEFLQDNAIKIEGQDDDEYNREMQKAQEQNANMSEGQDDNFNKGQTVDAPEKGQGWKKTKMASGTLYEGPNGERYMDDGSAPEKVKIGAKEMTKDEWKNWYHKLDDNNREMGKEFLLNHASEFDMSERDMERFLDGGSQGSQPHFSREQREATYRAEDEVGLADYKYKTKEDVDKVANWLVNNHYAKDNSEAVELIKSEMRDPSEIDRALEKSPYKSKYEPEDFEDARFYPSKSTMDENNRWVGRYHSMTDAHGLRGWYDENVKHVGNYNGTAMFQLPDGYYSINPNITSMSFKTKEALENYLSNKNPEEHKYGAYYDEKGNQKIYHGKGDDGKEYDMEGPDAYKAARKNKPQRPAMTSEQRQAIREQINKMVASLDDARSLDEAWDIEEGIKELEDMLKKYKGK